MFKRCYININRFLEDILIKELSYLFKKTNQHACLFSNKFKSIKNVIEEKLNDDIALYDMPFRKEEMRRFHNFYFYLEMAF